MRIMAGMALAPSLIGVRSARARPNAFRPGLNLTGMSYWASEQAFSNLAYNASGWRVQPNDAPYTTGLPLPPMTAEGYPLEIPAGSSMESFLLFTPHRDNLPIDLSVLYDGKGKLGYRGGAELEKRMPGHDHVRNLRRGDAFTARLLETDPSDPLRNIRLYERNTAPQATFRTPFLNRLRPMGVLRFMDWMGTNNSPVSKWAERQKTGLFGRSDEGVPLETMVELCNLVKISPWFNMPHLADDDYIRTFAETVRDALDPALPIHVEYSNECWNGIFKQAGYCADQGLALGLSANRYEAQLRFYAKRTSEVLAIWKAVFGASGRERIKGVYAAQSVNDWTSTTILSFDGVREHADMLAIAPYFGGGLGSEERAAEVSNYTLDQIFAALERELDHDDPMMLARQARIAADHGVELVSYEGGQHLVAMGGADDDTRRTDLFIAANRDPRMGALYLRHFENWRKAGGGLYALFSSMSEPSKWGSWGLLEYEGDANPKWNAVQQLLLQRNR